MNHNLGKDMGTYRSFQPNKTPKLFRYIMIGMIILVTILLVGNIIEMIDYIFGTDIIGLHIEVNSVWDFVVMVVGYILWLLMCFIFYIIKWWIAQFLWNLSFKSQFIGDSLIIFSYEQRFCI